MWIGFHQIEEICGRWWLVRYDFWWGGWEYEVIVMIVLEEIEQWADVRMSIHDLSLDPEWVRLRTEAGRVPRPPWW